MMMSRKKTSFILSLIILLPALVHATYQPLVPIPGLPAEGVTISSYLVGLYNFLLSIVGIVAVMMLILGGMRYISSAGNASATQDAKDMIQSAVLGLFLALFSWVIISTINPDLLYIRQPGGVGGTNSLSSCLSDFTADENGGSGNCICGPFSLGADGAITGSSSSQASSADACSQQCLESKNCPMKALSAIDRMACIAPGSYTGSERGNYNCTCMDGNTIQHRRGESCNQLCQASNFCGAKFLVIGVSSDGQLDNSPVPAYSLTDGGELWEMFLSNTGSYGNFRVTASSHTGSDGSLYTCAILASSHRPNSLIGAAAIGLIGGAAGAAAAGALGGIDSYSIIWVKEGAYIRKNANNILHSLGDPGARMFDICCNDDNNNTPACTVNATASVGPITVAGGCAEGADRERVIRTRFGYATRQIGGRTVQGVTDNCSERGCSFAQGDGMKESHDFWPAYDITCKDGRWQPA